MSSNPAQQTIVVNSSFISRVGEFIPGSDWKHYIEQAEMFFEVNSVTEDKKVLMILSLMGNKMYALLRNVFKCLCLFHHYCSTIYDLVPVFLQESRLTTEDLILTFWCVLLPW